ncbi:restriction endonuclease subunit S [Bradyrhizobium sp. SZCCHNRI3052]|uniref:restriction endonuclease subunit S n=1 Tax=Bradyrhizobium sp. SZCCHNRI3052 TaxID=3057295 RepID=UPI002916596A|nr:restriction endonuclease subunit S [Bradyrhizobium sp. SZCCHNRI3052]
MNVHFGGFEPDGIAYLNEAQAQALAGVTVQANDVLLNITGASIGRVCLAPEFMSGARVNQHVCIIRLARELLPSYFERFLASPGMQRWILEENYGFTRQALTKGMIEQLVIPVPPLAEQRRIVAKLDALFARLARARAELDRTAALAEKARGAVYASAFSPFTQQSFKLGSALEDVRYGTAKKCDYGNGVPVLRIPNVANGRISLEDLKRAEFEDDELAKLSLRRGDVLIIRSNGSRDLVGRSAVVDDGAAGMLYAGYLIRLRLDESKLLPDYLHAYLASPQARQLIEALARSTSGVNNINAEQLKGLSIPSATLEAQRSIISAIRSANARADRLEAEAARARALLDRLEAAILTKAFKGELVPQDPNDEPASVLLERIRAQRAAANKEPRQPRSRRAAASRLAKT